MTTPVDTRIREAERQLAFAADERDSDALRAAMQFVAALNEDEVDVAGGEAAIADGDAKLVFAVLPRSAEVDTKDLAHDIGDAVEPLTPDKTPPIEVVEDEDGDVSVRPAHPGGGDG